jgi:hypothetical protein
MLNLLQISKLRMQTHAVEQFACTMRSKQQGTGYANPRILNKCSEGKTFLRQNSRRHG